MLAQHLQSVKGALDGQVCNCSPDEGIGAYRLAPDPITCVVGMAAPARSFAERLNRISLRLAVPSTGMELSPLVYGPVVT